MSVPDQSTRYQMSASSLQVLQSALPVELEGHKRFWFVPSLTVCLLVALVDYNPERELLGLLLAD